MADWRISRRQGVCGACERSFEDGERHVSVLRISAEGFERTDVCSSCRAAEGESADSDLFWWATRHALERKKTVQLDLESLERLFLELEGHGSRPVQELRYLLCLILMRKRRVRVERVLRTAEGEAFLVRRPRREEQLEVRVFDFEPERLEELRTQLQAIFDGAEAVDGVSVGEADTSGEPDEQPEGTAEPEPTPEVTG